MDKWNFNMILQKVQTSRTGNLWNSFSFNIGDKCRANAASSVHDGGGMTGMEVFSLPGYLLMTKVVYGRDPGLTRKVSTRKQTNGGFIWSLTADEKKPRLCLIMHKMYDNSALARQSSLMQVQHPDCPNETHMHTYIHIQLKISSSSRSYSKRATRSFAWSTIKATFSWLSGDAAGGAGGDTRSAGEIRLNHCFALLTKIKLTPVKGRRHGENTPLLMIRDEERFCFAWAAEVPIQLQVEIKCRRGI